MTVSNNSMVNFTHVNTPNQMSVNSNANLQQKPVLSDSAIFSDAAKQMAQMHSQSGASGPMAQSSSMMSSPLLQSANSNSSAQGSLQSMLMQNILSAYGASMPQNGSNSMSLMA